MPRVKRGTVRRAKRKKLLGLAKGYYANKSKLYRAAKESVDTATLGSVVVLVGISLPPARLTLRTTISDGTVPGILHVHTTRSDGGGTVDEVAAAAARAGLAFVIFTDHGDGTRAPDAPVYR